MLAETGGDLSGVALHPDRTGAWSLIGWTTIDYLGLTCSTLHDGLLETYTTHYWAKPLNIHKLYHNLNISINIFMRILLRHTSWHPCNKFTRYIPCDHPLLSRSLISGVMHMQCTFIMTELCTHAFAWMRIVCLLHWMAKTMTLSVANWLLCSQWAMSI